MFILEHQDGIINFEKVNGGYAVKDSKLYISLETKSLDEGAFPDSFLFALDCFPISSGLSGLDINISTNPNDEPPNVYVYTTFHACEVAANLKISAALEDKITVDFHIVSDDVNYYDERAKPNPFKGVTTLTRKEPDQLWLPV